MNVHNAYVLVYNSSVLDDYLVACDNACLVDIRLTLDSSRFHVLMHAGVLDDYCTCTHDIVLAYMHNI